MPIVQKKAGSMPRAPKSVNKGHCNCVVFEKLASEISDSFVRNLPDQTYEKVLSALEKIRHFFGVDRCGLLLIGQDSKHWQVTHSVSHSDVPELPLNEILANELFPWNREQLVMHRPVIFSSTDQLPDAAAVDKKTYHEWGIQSNMTIPIAVDSSMHYCIVITSDRKAFVWSEEYILRLRLFGEILVKAILLTDSQLRLSVQQEFESLASSISAGFLLTPADSINDNFRSWFANISTFFDVDNCSLILFSKKETKLVKDYEYFHPDNFSSGQFLWESLFPSYMSKLVNGEPVAINSLEYVPDTAKKKPQFFSENQSSSIFLMPIKITDTSFGVFTLICLKSRKLWTEKLAKRLQFIAELLVMGIARYKMHQQLATRLHEIENLKNQLEAENIILKNEIVLHHQHNEIVGRSQAMQTILTQIEQVAPLDTTVLILGETGVGKEVVARALHRLSNRRDRPLVTVNCASLPPTLIESELFGREKGAYTGAITRMTGRFELADKATLFLDEIGELPKEIQAKLLRVIEQGRFERLGSNKPLHVNFRLIAATNRNLEQETTEGNFRKDLYYRLNVFPIRIPPLRERTEDIPPLVWSFIREFEKKMGKRVEHVTDRSIKALMHYDWPGNARELRNVVEHAMIVSSSRTLAVVPPVSVSYESNQHISLEDIERDHILKVLLQKGWRISGKDGAAKALGIKRTTLQSRMKKLGLQRHA
jgi:transcriptional regulator with GAF, ATPase, and Fis domain